MRLVLALALCLAAAPLASAQDGKPAAVTAPAEPLSFDALAVQPDELPKDVKIVEGLFCATPRTAALYTSKEMSEFRLPLLRKSAQSFVGADEKPGAALWFVYGENVDQGMRDYVESALWGDAKQPTVRQPEQLWIQGKVVLILSAPRGTAAAEWFKSRLRSRFGLVAPRWSPELAALRSKLWTHLDKRESDAGIALLAASEALIEKDANAHYYRGGLAKMKDDWTLAEKGFRRALELHATREDPLSPQIHWGAMDGLGYSLLAQKAYDVAAIELRKAADLGRSGKIKGWPTSFYNLACAQARLERWPEALAALKEATSGDAKFLETAKKDDDLAEAIKRPEFKALLGL